MVEDGLPRWKVGGEIAPWAAGAQHVEDRIENGPQRVNWRSATFGQGREITLQALPLRIRKIAGITCTHLSSLSCEAISAINKTRSKIHTIFYWRAKIPLTYRSFCSVLLGSAVDFVFFDPTMILAERKPGLCGLLSRQIWEKVTDQGQLCFVTA